MDKRNILISVGIAAASFIGGWFLCEFMVEPQVVVEEKVEWKERIVTNTEIKEVVKYVKVTSTVTEREITTTKPDGTTVVEKEKTRTNENTQVDSSRNTNSTTDTKVEAKVDTKTVRIQRDWRVGGTVGVDFSNPFPSSFGDLVYGASVERRIIGPIYLGVWGNTGKQGGISVGVEF